MELGGVIYRSLDQVRILQYLGKEEAVLEIILWASSRRIHISHFCVSATRARRRIDVDVGIPSIITVLLILCCSPRVVETLNDLWAQDVVAVVNVEASTLVEGRLAGGNTRTGGSVAVISGRIAWGGAGSIDVADSPAEDFRANAGQRAIVCVLTAFNQGKTEVCVLLFTQDETAEDEVAAVKTSH